MIGPSVIIDVGELDVRRLFANIAVAKKVLHVQRGELTHVLLNSWTEDSPTVNIYLGNSFNESGYLKTTMSGDELLRIPYERMHGGLGRDTEECDSRCEGATRGGWVRPTRAAGDPHPGGREREELDALTRDLHLHVPVMIDVRGDSGGRARCSPRCAAATSRSAA